MAFGPDKALCSESKLRCRAERSNEVQQSGMQHRKSFIVLFSPPIPNLNLLQDSICKTPFLFFPIGRCSGRVFSASGNFTLSFRFQLEKNLYSTWCPELFKCCVCLKARE